MATTPPGWYDDGRGALRWWDGAQWTEHVQTPDPEPDGQADMDALLAPAVERAPTLESASAGADGIPASASADTWAADSGYPPSAPPGYPGGFPGGDNPSGGFIAATDRKKSKLWILWVVIGVVLLGIVVLAAVLIPVAIGLLGSANGGGTGSASDDEAAAVAAVQLYDEAWRTADCDKFTEATTENFREGQQLLECETFAAASQGFIDSVEGYEVSVTSVDAADDQITVVTSETYTSTLDAEGNPTDEAVEYEDRYAYIVVPSEGGWAIDQALDATQ